MGSESFGESKPRDKSLNLLESRGDEWPIWNIGGLECCRTTLAISAETNFYLGYMKFCDQPC